MLVVSVTVDELIREDHTGLAGVPVFTWKLFKVVLKTAKPVAGNIIAFSCAVVMRGSKKPLVVLLTSSIALVSGMLPVEFIATFCENSFVNTANDNKSVRALVFIDNQFDIG